MINKSFVGVLLIALLAMLSLGSSSAEANLLAIDWSGQLFSVNETNAELSLIGSTGIEQAAALEFGPNGTLYGFRASDPQNFYTIDPSNANASTVGAFGFDWLYEGGLAFGRDGTAYGVNGHYGPGSLFSIDLNNGNATDIATFASTWDVNGLAWRSDGMLVGMASSSNGDYLLEINPTNAAVDVITQLDFGIGAIGGMTFGPMADKGFFGTGATDSYSGNVSSNSLYSFDFYTGSHTFIGEFNYAGGDVDQYGIAGLAYSEVPEPASMLLLGIGLAGLGLHRRRRNK